MRFISVCWLFFWMKNRNLTGDLTLLLHPKSNKILTLDGLEVNLLSDFFFFAASSWSVNSIRRRYKILRRHICISDLSQVPPAAGNNVRNSCQFAAHFLQNTKRCLVALQSAQKLFLLFVFPLWLRPCDVSVAWTPGCTFGSRRQRWERQTSQERSWCMVEADSNLPWGFPPLPRCPTDYLFIWMQQMLAN